MENTVIIRNPLIFFNWAYLYKYALIEQYSTGKIEIISANEIPIEILISFPSSDLASSFINRYNGRYFEETLISIFIV